MLRTLILFLILLIPINCIAGIFGVSTYEECIDEVVKNVKFKEALFEGQSNCYEKYIRPKQDKIQNKAWQSKYRSATENEISQLKCNKEPNFQNYFIIKCKFENLSMSDYAQLSMAITSKNKKILTIEFKNYAPDLKWKNEPLMSFNEFEIVAVDRKSLRIKDSK